MNTTLTSRIEAVNQQAKEAGHEFPPLVAYRALTPGQVKEFAMRGNHAILYKCCTLFEAGNCSWEEALQVAVISQAVELDRVMKRLVKTINGMAK